SVLEVGCEDLNVAPLAPAIPFLEEQHRDRVRFLTRCATGHPHPQLPTPVVFALQVVEEPRDDLVRQRLPGLGITEKARDGDEQVREERLRLLGILAEK